MKAAIAGLDPAAYRPHRLHDAERRWPQTNCYVDLLIEVLHATGHDPVAALGFTVTQDFEGDQFTFFKFPTADLQRLAGLDIQELAIFDRLETHLLAQIDWVIGFLEHLPPIPDWNSPDLTVAQRVELRDFAKRYVPSIQHWLSRARSLRGSVQSIGRGSHDAQDGSMAPTSV